ncbi:EthD family reductase [Cupriavidus sp. UYPR2.512]|uniref:EthD domain-containing protein n=1 Tax=Cupriavidus sp. UYPR2.512 TaxID=1080187 RepID=UPI000380B753|nr:EthD family reductase [Cupriavidus sp. UYPR2.512]UIF91521.1 EthD family reductase [Cupriavidus necator]
MIHLIFLCKRRADADRSEFLRYWRDVHAPLVAGLPGVRRYVQNTVQPVPGHAEPYCSVDEIWVEDAAAVDSLMRSAGYGRSALAGAGNLVDPVHGVRLQTIDHVMLAGRPISADESLPKRITFFKRMQSLSQEAMLRYWRGTHGPLAASVPRLRRYVQSAMQPTTVEPRFDGAAQIWFEDAAALQAAIRSPFFRESVKPDEANFIATDTALTLSIEEEHRIVWPRAA